MSQIVKFSLKGTMSWAAVCLTVCLSAGIVNSKSQQYDIRDDRGGNIFAGGLHQKNTIPHHSMPGSDPRTAGDTCTFTFSVPSTQVFCAGCPPQRQQYNTGHDQSDMIKMNNDIVQLEARMIARDASTRRELKSLREQLHRERMRFKMDTAQTGDVSNLPADNGKLQTKLASLGSEVTFLQKLTAELRRQVRYLEEQVRSVDPSPRAEIITHVSQGNCPPNFERYNNSCYSYYRDKRTWYKSRDFCQQIGGHLVSIETEGEQKFIKEFLNNKGARRDAFWVYAGGNDLDNDQEWTWIGTNHVVRHPEFWYSKVTPPPDTGFVCMFLYLWDAGQFAKWTKDRCDFQMPSICEISLEEQQP